MARAFKFMAGDVVRLRENHENLIALLDGCGKEYREHLRVCFCFWDGCRISYVLNTGNNDICLICDEDSLELEERPPMPQEEVQPECTKESHFLGSVYRINNRLVAAESIEKAIKLFRSHPTHLCETIESITLQGDLALIQNGNKE